MEISMQPLLVHASKLMQFLSLSSAALGLFATTSARANDVTNVVSAVGSTTFFGAIHTDDIEFVDTHRFEVSGVLSANVSLITIGDGANAIDFLGADLNGVALSLSPHGFLETGALGDTPFSGPLVLTVRGRSGAAGGIFASYSGTLNVAYAPEPSPLLLLGLGIGGLGLAGGAPRLR